MQEFEKHYNGSLVEKEMQKYWEDNEVYKFKKDPSKKIFSIDTPPPTVNGKLHIGHIFSYTQAEIMARYKRMQGFNVYYPFGFDDNGLPSERLVERENNIKAFNVPRSIFCEKCIETTQKYEQEFKDLWKSLGFSCDWDLCYSTVSKSSQKVSQKAFIDLAKNGNAYIKESPVLWCTECQTSIAQAELETKEIDTYFNYIPFIVDGKVLEIATTRPELLYGVVCVFVNPEDERYKNLIGKNAKVPLYNFEVPIIADESVAIDKGTGVVMCATFGDATDAEWYQKYNLPYKKVILPNGIIADDIPYIAGKNVFDARMEIVRLLKENNLLLKSDKITHMVAVHERCGTSVEILPSKQWYIDVLNHKEELLTMGNKIKWNPASMQTRYNLWVENLKWDWCISRQRYFGVPFPVWYCKKCGKPHFAKEEDLPVNPLEKEYNSVCECGSKEFVPESAVLDTWATSSISPLLNQEKAKEYGLDPDEFIPMGVRTQAHEIIRTWAFYTIVRSMYYKKDIPWKEIMLSGIVLAKPGEKISKSKSNATLSPKELIEKCTADYIRYGTANVKLGLDTFFDEQNVMETSKRFINKLWNSSKFVLSHLFDFNPNEKVELLPIDKWIVEKVNKTVKEAQGYLDNYEIGLARKVIDEFFWADLCDDYIEIVKDRLYKPEVHGEQNRKSAQHAIFYTLLTLLKMYSIYIPHLTEYIYLKGFKDIVGEKSIHLLSWPKIKSVDAELLEFGKIVSEVIGDARRYKTENNLSMKTEMEKIEIKTPNKFMDYFKQTEKDLVACTSAQKIIYIEK